MKARLTSLFLLALAGAASAAPTIQQRVNAIRDEAMKSGHPATVEALEKARAEEPDFATNGFARAYIDQQIVEKCRRPPWPSFGRAKWSIDMESLIPDAVRRDLADPEVPANMKVTLGLYLSEYYAGEKLFDEAEKVLKALIPETGDDKAQTARVWCGLCDLYRWQDRFADAWAALDKAQPLSPVEAARKAGTLPQDDEGKAKTRVLWEQAGNERDMFKFYQEHGRPAWVKDLVFKYISATNNNAGLRMVHALAWFPGDREPLEPRALKAISDINFENLGVVWEVAEPTQYAFRNGDWAKAIRYFEDFNGVRGLSDPGMRRIQIITLVMLDRRQEAIDLAKKYADGEQAAMDKAKAEAADEKTAPEKAKTLLDGAQKNLLAQARYRVLAEQIAGGDGTKAVQAAEAAGLGHKDVVTLVRSAVRYALQFGMNDVAEKLAAKHTAFFTDYPTREQKVVFSKKPIISIEDWRKLYPTLDKQLCDRPFGARLDVLETDVATGRKLVEKTDKDTKEVAMEVTSVCDVNGLHIFLRVEDPNARAVENGFAGGVGTEMYFSPGRYEPYTCFGSNPRAGVEWDFATLYDSKTHERLDMTGRKTRTNFKSETFFTDTDYVLHLLFTWDSFWAKMPANGTKWCFECISWTPSGPFSWGGSIGVHHSSNWGDLTFQLAPEDITAIRRKLLFRYYRNWRQLGRLDRFDKWADPGIGDPEFYNEVLAPIEKELAGYAAEVRQDMTDADVNRVFEAAYARWRGLAHDIDALRKEWLKGRFCE